MAKKQEEKKKPSKTDYKGAAAKIEKPKFKVTDKGKM